jgi:hypothetical protein
VSLRAVTDPKPIRMSEKTESDEYDEEEDEVVEESDLDVDHLIKDLESLKRRGPKVSDPAWRRLERLMEEKRTSEQLSDFDDYDIGADDDGSGHRPRKKRKH